MTDAKEIIELATKVLIADLKAGKSDSLKSWLATQAQFHSYSWSNSLLIMFQRPNATRVAGARKWEVAFGRKVTSSAKPIKILAPCIVKKNKGAVKGTPEAEEKKLVGFRLVNVFDVVETEGKELPVFSRPSGDVAAGALEKLKGFVAAKGLTLHYGDLGGPYGYYSPVEESIHLQQGHTPAVEFSTLAHEVAHAILHSSEKRREETSKTVREVEAEATAFIVSTAVGLECGKSASDYLLLYNGDEKVLTQSLQQIQKAAHEIITALEAA